MGSSRAREGAPAAIVLILLMGSSAAFADPNPVGSSQPLTFTVGSAANPVGTVLNLGDQRYVVSGGQVITAKIAGIPLDPGATLKFSMTAEVKDLKAIGNVNFNLQGTLAGKAVSVLGDFQISSAQTLAQVLPGPSGTCTGPSAKSCSELPVFFGGAADVLVKAGDPSKPLRMAMELENPYFNPFGMPILLASADGSIFIITTYDAATIQWLDSQVGGPITGTLGTSTPVSGTLSLNSTEQEDLVTGTAVDRGTIALDSMSPATLNTVGAPGRYSGISTIPPPPNPLPAGLDCTPMFLIPGVSSGLCTETGFNSMGQFTLKGDPRQTTTITGQYATTWTTPALAFSSIVTGTVTTQTK
jgi:hypothetical protein